MENSTPITDHAQLLKIAGGDEKAFSAFFHAYSGWVYSIAFSFTKQEAVSEEIVQDIFLYLWLKREVTAGIDDVRNWLFIVTRNRSLKVLKQMAEAERRMRAHAETVAEDMVEQDAYVGREFQGIVQEALQLLTPQQRKVFELIKINGLTRNEAAAALGLSPHTVKVHMALSLPVVRDFLVKRLGKTVAPLLFSAFFEEIFLHA